MSDWTDLGAVPASALSAARAQCRFGAHWLARIARSYAPAGAAPLALIWSDEIATTPHLDPERQTAPHLRLAAPFPARLPIVSDRLIAVYAPADHTLRLGAAGRPNNVLRLAGRDAGTIGEMLPRVLASLGADQEALADPPPSVRCDAPAAIAERAAVDALCRSLSNMNGLFETLPGRRGPVLLGPETLALACDLALDGAPHGEPLTVSFTPGDGEVEQPLLTIDAPTAPGPAQAPAPSPPWRWRAPGRLIAPIGGLMAGAGARARVLGALENGLVIVRRTLIDRS